MRRIDKDILLNESCWLTYVVLLVQVTKVTEVTFGTVEIDSAYSCSTSGCGGVV